MTFLELAERVLKEEGRPLTQKEIWQISNLGEEVFIPDPVREYPPVHFLEIAHAYGD